MGFLDHSAAAAKSLQSCLTLCDPIDGSPPGSPHPWDSPGKNPGVGCHFLLPCLKVRSESEVAQSCPTLSDPMDCSPPGSSIHGIFQARALEWGAIAFSVWTTQVVSIQPSNLYKVKDSFNSSEVFSGNKLPFISLSWRISFSLVILSVLNNILLLFKPHSLWCFCYGSICKLIHYY